MPDTVSSLPELFGEIAAHLSARADEAFVVVALPGPTVGMHVVGSHLYGLATPESDLDLAYVFVQPTRALLGLYPPGERALTYEGRLAGPRRVEYVAHEVGKFCRLLLQGNPTMVERLWASPLAATPEWGALQERRRLFLSQAVVRQYLGYLTGQMRRLGRGASVHTTGGKINGKWAAHLLRIAWDLRALANGEEPVVQWASRPEPCAYLRAVRAGGAPLWNEAIAQAREILVHVNAQAPWDGWPVTGAKDWLEGWLLRVRHQYGGDPLPAPSPADAEKGVDTTASPA
jgi:hypothetical protein